MYIFILVYKTSPAKQIGTRPRWPLRHATVLNNYRLQIITETKHFCWWNVFHVV